MPTEVCGRWGGGARSSCLLAEPAEPPKRSDDLLKKKKKIFFLLPRLPTGVCHVPFQRSIQRQTTVGRIHRYIIPLGLGAGLAYYVFFFFLLLLFSPLHRPRSHVARFQVRRWALGLSSGNNGPSKTLGGNTRPCFESWHMAAHSGTTTLCSFPLLKTAVVYLVFTTLPWIERAKR